MVWPGSFIVHTIVAVTSICKTGHYDCHFYITPRHNYTSARNLRPPPNDYNQSLSFLLLQLYTEDSYWTG